MPSLRRLPLMPSRTVFSFANKSRWQSPLNSKPTIPQQELVDEEVCPDYSPASFYPAKPGEVLAKSFQLLVKIGWGSQSTVWLARDISRYLDTYDRNRAYLDHVDNRETDPDPYFSRHKWQSEKTVALKIVNRNNADDAQHEKEIERHITQQNPEHRGRVILRTCLDDFEVTGPGGEHICLVYELMREPLWILQRRFVDRRLPLPIAKAYIYFLLVGLDYLHSECKVVHADLKLDNILMSFENENILTNFIKRQQPMQCKVDDASGRTLYRCHNDFGAFDARELKNMIPKVTDFGPAARLDRPSVQNGMVGQQLGVYPIQPDCYRAPEVILGCGWDFKADIWNFGVLVRPLYLSSGGERTTAALDLMLRISFGKLWNILGSKELFQQVYDIDGQYDAKSHLGEMVALLGPPPSELLAKSKAMSKHNWPQPVTNNTGQVCNNAQEFFHGPFFDTEDEFYHTDVIPSRSLEDTIPFLEEKDREAFLSFVRQMLTWHPDKRKTARELMDHPFLKLGG